MPEPPSVVRETEENCITVLDAMEHWVVALDRDGRVGFWNRSAEKQSGYNRSDVLGHRKLWDWLYPDPNHRAAMIARIRTVSEHGDTLDDFQTTLTCHDGSTRLIAWTARKRTGEHGETLGVVAVGRDITRQRRDLDREQARVERLGRLNDIARELLALSSCGEIYVFLAGRLRALLAHRPMIIIDELSDDQAYYRIRAVAGSRGELGFLQRSVSKRLTNVDIGIQRTRLSLIRSGRLTRLEEGVEGLLGSSLSKDELSALSMFLGQTAVHTIGLHVDSRVLASISVITAGGNDGLDHELIEGVARLASVPVARIRASRSSWGD